MAPVDDAVFTLDYVETWDGLYTPIAVRFPPGGGPFPMVLLAHGNGGGGVAWLRDMMVNRAYLVDRMVAAGYACAWTRYRMEVDNGYARGGTFQRAPGPGNEVFNRSPLEYEDAIAIAEHVKNLPNVDACKVAWVGVSHGVEMLLKMADEYSGFAVGVASEPASHEFFGLGGSDVRDIKRAADTRGAAPLSAADVDFVRQRMPRDVVAVRTAAIATPMLVMGRDSDDLHAVFRATYDVLAEAGKDVEWTTYDHELHGYIFPPRGPDGQYEVDSVQEEAIAEVLAYLGRYLGTNGGGVGQ